MKLKDLLKEAPQANPQDVLTWLRGEIESKAKTSPNPEVKAFANELLSMILNPKKHFFWIINNFIGRIT